MKKQYKIVSSIVSLLLLIGLVYWVFSNNNTYTNIYSNENTNVDNTNIEKIDTSNWVTFEDKELGISYKHPVDCWQNWAGPGTNYTVSVSCAPGTFIGYSEVPTSFPNYNNGNIIDLKEIAEIYYHLNKEIKDYKIPTDRILTDVEKVEINGTEAYQFIIDSASYFPCEDDYTKSCGGGTMDGVHIDIFISNGSKNIKIGTIINDNIAQKIINTFQFIN